MFVIDHTWQDWQSSPDSTDTATLKPKIIRGASEKKRLLTYLLSWSVSLWGPWVSLSTCFLLCLHSSSHGSTARMWPRISLTSTDCAAHFYSVRFTAQSCAVFVSYRVQRAKKPQGWSKNSHAWLWPIFCAVPWPAGARGWLVYDNIVNHVVYVMVFFASKRSSCIRKRATICTAVWTYCLPCTTVSVVVTL